MSTDLVGLVGKKVDTDGLSTAGEVLFADVLLLPNGMSKVGANVKDEPVVRDRNWITSRKPDDLEQFSDAIVESLESSGEERAQTGRPGQPGAHA